MFLGIYCIGFEIGIEELIWILKEIEVVLVLGFEIDNLFL